jgi:hypothetical protein
MVDVQGKGETPIPPHVTYAVFPAVEVETDQAFSTYARLVAKKMNEQGYKPKSGVKNARFTA